MDNKTIINIAPEVLKSYMLERREHDYMVIDVRQEQEYKNGHIPGAGLIPLDSLENRVGELPVDREVFFYCRSGVRSRAASIIALQSSKPLKKIYNVSGGFLAWEGHVLKDVPKIALFDQKASQKELMYQAMDMEKAAQRFYEYMLERHADKSYAESVEQLAKAEIVHAEMIYQYWKNDDTGSFDMLYESLKGEILEGGELLSDTIAILDAGGSHSCIALLEMALSIEIHAYDLYRTMADKGTDHKIKEAFLSIAQMEKQHIQTVAGMIKQC